MKGKDLMKIYDEDGDLFMNNIEFVKKDIDGLKKSIARFKVKLKEQEAHLKELEEMEVADFIKAHPHLKKK